ncbi:MAG: hypothetical protein HFI09_00960 [Bacilli bacterium]|nr:hypothetical protein [Bacilli bacterium]
MFVFFSAFVASLDGFIIGLGLRLSHIKFSKKDILLFFLGNVIIYSFAIFAYTFFHFRFVTTLVSTILYLVLAYFTFIDSEEINTYEECHNLTFGKLALLILTHSLDGTLVSLGFVYDYSLFFLVLLFSTMSIGILLFGYYFGRLLKTKKKNRYIGSILFVLLAILNQFF